MENESENEPGVGCMNVNPEEVIKKFAEMDVQVVKNAMANTQFKDFPVRIKEIFEFILPHINKEESLFPAMMAAKIAGYNYSEEKHFIENVLKVQGREGVDWVSRKNKDIPEFKFPAMMAAKIAGYNYSDEFEFTRSVLKIQGREGVDWVFRKNRDIPEFKFPAMMAAKIAGYSYTEENDFIKKVVKVQGREGVDWVFLKNKDIPEFKDFNSGSSGNDFRVQNLCLEYDMPGNREKFVLERKRSNNSKYAFVSGNFMAKLCFQAKTNVGEAFSSLLIHLIEFYMNVKESGTNEAEVCHFEEEIGKIVVEPVKESQHDRIKEIVAKEMNGRTEVRNSAGVSDVETCDSVVEVKPCSEWMHGVGQVLSYSFATGGKRRILALYCDTKNCPSLTGVCNEVTKKYKIETKHYVVCDNQN